MGLKSGIAVLRYCGIIVLWYNKELLIPMEWLTILLLVYRNAHGNDCGPRIKL